MLTYICLVKLFLKYHSGRNRETLEWTARHKIAVGAARGLRYLHEECRVGCIIHRDMRPNNILVTHDFEPLVQSYFADCGVKLTICSCAFDIRHLSI
jgi:serine/threonine protein kinase